MSKQQVSLFNRRRVIGPEELSQKEIDVFRLVAKGLQMVAVANKLHISLYAALRRRQVAMEKKDLHNTKQITEFVETNRL